MRAEPLRTTRRVRLADARGAGTRVVAKDVRGQGCCGGDVAGQDAAAPPVRMSSTSETT